MSFENMKRNRTKMTEDLTKKLVEQSKGGGYAEDTRFWYPKRDKDKNASAVIRFLPALENDVDNIPYVRIFSHNFKGPSGLWYIENSLSTLGKEDPVVEYNTLLWNSTTDKDAPARKQASNQKRKLEYISNIYVEKDPASPENEGKVFLHRYGVQIFTKINEKMNADEKLGEQSFNPFDFWEGADFRFKIRIIEGQTSYNTSSFDNPSQFKGGDDKVLREIYDQQYKLSEFVAPDQFKEYDVLKAKLDKVLCLDGARSVQVRKPAEDEAPAPRQKTAESKSLPSVDIGDGEDDNAMDFLKKLSGSSDD